MHMRVSAEPPTLVHVDPSLQSEFEILLPRLDGGASAQRLVLESPRHVHYHVTPGKPALAGPIYVGIRNLAQPNVAANVDVPCSEIGVDLIVMAVRLIRYALR